MTDEPDKTPPRPRPIPISDLALSLASAGIALATAATRLEHSAELVRRLAVECAEASRLVDGDGPPDCASLLRDLEDHLGALAENIHDTRRKVRASRHALEEVKP